MDIGLSTAFLYERNILETLPVIRHGGFAALEIWSSPNGEEYSHFDWRNDDEVRAFERALRDHGLAVNSLHAPFSPRIDLSDGDEAVRKASVDAVKRTADVLKQVGGRFLVVHPATRESHGQDRNYRFQQSRKSLEELTRHAQALGVMVAVENQLPHILGGDVATLTALLEGLPRETVGICFDTSHAHLDRRTSLEAMFRELSDRVVTLHVSDNHRHYDDHLAPGAGTIHWQSFIDMLYALRYPGIFMLEVVGHYFGENKHVNARLLFERVTELLKR